ncbi:replication initiation protein RepC [Sinorhizobium meliloti]|uniref:plasmid replication protein RepC n=1 Tax=Rhizobium meliloti TaxID=382 RepID=UPI0003DDAEF4|nr:plasmid replication protein RepC [Sinorhizobium meliloti]ARS66150.1 replication initiation protein RepC [Sinorhizobium meliloti RU11/001]MDE3765516.1 replication initiation protein RepC [Sinorhizobium meliloti]MDE3779294.1 replication initiation protein RepC [Sinorhizobium meliloti]MDE3804865.1 replication initiation protein RepC [Sinorhizobium meliloti]RVG58984.1 replication initiation protein RepC [Sinorhizobium meliloti]
MQTGHVSTPFGRRSMTLALVKGQLSIAQSKTDKRADKWKVFRDISETRERLGLQDRALAVLDALLTFYPDNELDTGRGLVVFPSNAQLSLRAHGMAGTTLRRHLAALVEAGLIQRRDSPNGKRYAHRDRDGEIEQAYGFDLTPLAVRSAELAQLAQDVVAERTRFRRAKEALTICRRDVRKLITAAMEEGASGNWDVVESSYVGILDRLPRYATRQQVESTLDEMELLRDEVLNQLEIKIKAENTDGNANHNGRHIQNSKPESIHELEPSSRNEQGEKLKPEPETNGKAQVSEQRSFEQIKAFPLGMVLRACPQISDYGPGGKIEHWRELIGAAVTVRSMLGVSPSAYEEACGAMGPENAAVAMACILERSNMINSAGGYLRDLTKRSERGEFSLGPMLMALLKISGAGGRLAG